MTKKILVLVFLLTGTAWARLNRTNPFDPITQQRLDVYTDAIQSIYYSTYTIIPQNWDQLNSTYTYFSSSQVIQGYIAYHVPPSTPAWTVQFTTWTLKDYSALITKEDRLRSWNKILDDDVEEYLIWPSTTSCPPGWQGWMLAFNLDGSTRAVTCPSPSPTGHPMPSPPPSGGEQ